VVKEYKTEILKNIAETSSGGTPSRENLDYYKGDIPWITTGELKDGYIFDSKEHITQEALKNSAAKVFPAGTVLMAMYGATIGRLGILKIDAATNQACCAFFTNEKILNAKYLFYWLFYHRSELIDMGAGAGQPNISQNIIQKLEIDLPTIQEQTCIVNTLSDIDNLIFTQESLIAKKQALKQGAKQELLTRKRRLAGFTGKWQVKAFYELFDILPNNTFPRDKMQNYPGTIGNIHYGDVLIKYGELLDCRNSEIPYLLDDITINNPRCFAQSGDVIISDTAEDETVGKVTELVNVDGCKIVSGLHTFLCRPKDKDSLALGWLGYYMNAERYHEQILTYVTGIKVSSISKTNIANTVIEIPAKDEQKAIVDVLKDIDRDIASQQAKLEKLRRIKSGMMDKLLTGKIRLTD